MSSYDETPEERQYYGIVSSAILIAVCVLRCYICIDCAVRYWSQSSGHSHDAPCQITPNPVRLHGSFTLRRKPLHHDPAWNVGAADYDIVCDVQRKLSSSKIDGRSLIGKIFGQFAWFAWWICLYSNILQVEFLFCNFHF